MPLFTFFVAIIVNFFGYLPLGNINLTTIQISINKGVKQALVFVLTFSIIEGIVTYILMNFAAYFAEKKDFLHWLGWILVLVLFIMGTISLVQAYQKPKEQIQVRKRDSIRTGIILGVFNPMIIPYWAIGGTYLIANNWITTEGFGLELFAIGAAIGCFTSLYLFAHFAQHLQNKFSFSHKVINLTIAIVFFGLAALQASKELFF
jgi:threonine/homoserine/homoserine lactone efflux protein